MGRALAIGVAVSLAVTVLSRVGQLNGWETRALDTFLFFRDRVPTPAIVLVTIDEDAFQALGERQPLDRRYLAELADFLLRNGARVVGFDVHLHRASVPAEDEALVAVARKWAAAPRGRLVFTTVATAEGDGAAARWTPTPPFSPALPAVFGYANAPLSGDGVVRRMLPVLPARDGGYLPSFAVGVLAAYEGAGPAEIRAGLAGDGARLTLPVGDARRGIYAHQPVALGTLRDTPWRIDYAGPPGSFATFPSGAIVQVARSGAPVGEDNPFRDKIVLVGATFAESRDFYPTPLGLMPGVEIQANAVHTLLARRALLPPPWWLNLALLVGTCVAVSLLSLRLRALWSTVVSAGILVALVALSWEAYSRGYWLDFVAPLAGMKLYGKTSSWLARRRLNRAFGEYVSPAVMERVLREGAPLGGEVRTVSVLMSDLRGFTTLSERLSPGDVSRTMNEYFEAMVEAIMARDGTVQDFIGDGILAVYGAPLADPDHAWHAVDTARDMVRALDRLNARWQAEGRPTLALGVAINTGPVFAGNVGAARKKKYAVIGDTVNTVSRMEGLNKELGTTILVSAATAAAVRERVKLRERGSVTVKGRAQPVELFEVLEDSSGRGSG
jgi:adenylate cyclase